MNSTDNVKLVRVWMGEGYTGWDLGNIAIDRQLCKKRVFITAGRSFEYGVDDAFYQMLAIDPNVVLVDIDELMDLDNEAVLEKLIQTSTPSYVLEYVGCTNYESVLEHFMCRFWGFYDTQDWFALADLIKVFYVLFGTNYIFVNMGTRLMLPKTHPEFNLIESLAGCKTTDGEFSNIPPIGYLEGMHAVGNISKQSTFYMKEDAVETIIACSKASPENALSLLSSQLPACWTHSTTPFFTLPPNKFITRQVKHQMRQKVAWMGARSPILSKYPNMLPWLKKLNYPERLECN